MLPLISSPGGKYLMAPKILRYFPKHKVYCEPFFGGGGLFFRKKPSEKEVINDFDKDIYQIYKFAQNFSDEDLARLKKYNFRPSLALWKKLKASEPKSELEKFRKTYYLTRHSYNKIGASPSFTKVPDTVKIFDRLLQARERLKNVTILNQDYKTVVKNYDSKDTFFYFDPPYKKDWKNDFGLKKFDEDEFIEVLKSIKGKFLVTYETSSKSKFKGFNIKTISVRRIMPQKPQNRTIDHELLVTNYEMKPFNIYMLAEREFPEFVLIDDFISETGSQVYGKHPPNDRDLVIRVPRSLYSYIYFNHPDILEALNLKLERIYGDKIHYIPSSVGANWTFIPIYDLVLRPKKEFIRHEIDEPEFKKTYYAGELIRSANEEIKNQAETSKKEDAVIPGRFFYLQSTKHDAIMANEVAGKYDVSKVDEFLRKRNLYGKVLASKKYDGNCVAIHKKGSNVEVYSEDGRRVPDERIPTLISEAREFKTPNFILLAEIELWENNKHLNREDVAGYLHSKGIGDDSTLVANCFDCLFYNSEDIHKKDAIERYDMMKKLGFKQSTSDIPKTSIKFNLVPQILIEDEKQMATVLTNFAECPASEGSILKWGSYSLTGSGDMLKWKKYEELKAIVLKVNTTKVPTVYNYELGVRFKDEPIDEKEIWEINGKKYHHIGRSYNTNLKCKVGDIITIRFHTMNLYRG